MKHPFLLVFAFLSFTAITASAKPKQNSSAATTGTTIAPPVESVNVSPYKVRTHEFQGDDISLVLRTLARQAGQNVVISNDVKGTVTMRLENKTPWEAFNIVASTKQLTVDQDKSGVYVVKSKNPPAKDDPSVSEALSKPGEDLTNPLAQLFGGDLSGSLEKLVDGALDYMAKPETAKRLARVKRAYYDALIAEGFTKDEAFRIILTNQEFNLPASNNK